MRTITYVFLLALIPTLSFASFSTGTFSTRDLEGYWYDTYSGTELEIQSKRNKIKVRKVNGRRSSWRTYDHRGRGLYDDCNGRTILQLGYDRIEWRTRRGQRVRLLRSRDFGRYPWGRPRYRDRDDRYGDLCTDRSRDWYGSNRRYTVSDYCGNWYADRRGISLRIERYRSGLRAYYDGAWTYYEPYDDYYVDRRGNRYYCEGEDLIWQSRNGRDRLRFGR